MFRSVETRFIASLGDGINEKRNNKELIILIWSKKMHKVMSTF